LPQALRPNEQFGKVMAIAKAVVHSTGGHHHSAIPEVPTKHPTIWLANLLIRAPSIGSFYLLKGWTDSSLDTFTAAVNHIVQENPVLTGKCFGDIFSIQPDEIRIYPGAFLPNNHSFVQAVDISSDTTCPSPADLQGPTEQLRYINRHVSPLIGKGGKTVADLIKDQLPLFRVNVVRVKDNYAVMHMEMSHCIGDFITFYHIAEQISCSEKGEQIRPIEWDNPGIASHELYPDTFTKRDVDRSYGLPFFFGILWQLPGSILFRKTQCLLLSREKIKLKVDEIEARGGGSRVTSNDIVTAALCDMCRSTDVFAFTRSMRGIVSGLNRRTGGNLHCEVPLLPSFEIKSWKIFSGTQARVSCAFGCSSRLDRLSQVKPPIDVSHIFKVQKGLASYR
jgi:hypothetical protein